MGPRKQKIYRLGAEEIVWIWAPTSVHRAAMSIFCPILPNHLKVLNMFKTNNLGALLVASGLLNSYIKVHPD